MREILFRGKTRDGDWRESSAVFIRGELAIMLNERPIKELIKDKNGELVDVIFSFCAVEKNTVGQFTGLTDKNGKKIFEGDILEILQISSRDKKDEIPEKIILYVAYGADGYPRLYLPNEKGSIPFFYWNYREINVIGNIHDNPELLEELQNG